jgi:hypothetical protein
MPTARAPAPMSSTGKIIDALSFTAAYNKAEAIIIASTKNIFFIIAPTFQP